MNPAELKNKAAEVLCRPECDYPAFMPGEANGVHYVMREADGHSTSIDIHLFTPDDELTDAEFREKVMQVESLIQYFGIRTIYKDENGTWWTCQSKDEIGTCWHNIRGFAEIDCIRACLEAEG